MMTNGTGVPVFPVITPCVTVEALPIKFDLARISFGTFLIVISNVSLVALSFGSPIFGRKVSPLW